jgi:hypothetical protein
MELERARSRSSTERGQVQQLLAEIGKARTDDHEATLQRVEDASKGRSIRLACCCANFPFRQSSCGLSQESQSTGHGESCFIGDYFGLAISGMKV